ncbi:effector-associated constant component EACC1 [Kitasatospora sp. NPDC004289]
MEAWISVLGGDPVRELQELDGWLNEEPELRGKVRPRAARPGHGELGAPYDVLIAAIGSGGVVTVLAGSLHGYLTRPRGADVRISVSSPDGRSVELEAQRVEDVEALLRQVIAATEEPGRAGAEVEDGRRGEVEA